MAEEEYRIDIAIANSYADGRFEGQKEGYQSGLKIGREEVTKKDFELIADILRGARVPKRVNVQQYELWINLVKTFMHGLARTHPDFNKARFLQACGALTPATAQFFNLTEK